MTSPIRILHLSDFHTGKDSYGQRVLFENILKHVRSRVEKKMAPDLVLVTGDIAQGGDEKEYQTFTEEFASPLRKLLPASRLFIVPGNHDVDRNKAKAAQGYDILEKCPNFFKPTTEGHSERETLFPRFRGYVEGLKSVTNTGWVFSEAGTHSEITPVGGVKLGILLLNTAWCSGGDGEQLKLRLAKDMVAAGLKALKNADFIMVLGHHPLGWLKERDADQIEVLFGKAHVLYLNGHLHQGKGRVVEGAGENFLALQAGAGFQAREDDQWVNGFQWYEWTPKEGIWCVEPLCWHSIHDEWRLDTVPFPNKRRVPGQDRWQFSVKKVEPKVGKTTVDERVEKGFRVLLLTTPKDLGSEGPTTVKYLRDTLNIEARGGSPSNIPDVIDFDLVVLIQAWWWNAGVLPQVWKRVDKTKRLLVAVDQEADWPPMRLIEKAAVEEVDSFLKQNPSDATFQSPGEIPGIVGKLVEEAMRNTNPGDGNTSGLSEVDRCYLEMRLPAWKAGRTGVGKGFTGPDDIYEERFYVPLDAASERWSWDEKKGLVPVDKDRESPMERGGKGTLRKPIAWWVSRSELPWLVLSGSPGAGKTVFLTRLAAAIANVLLGRQANLEPKLELANLRTAAGFPIPITLEATDLAARNGEGVSMLLAAMGDEMGCSEVLEPPTTEELKTGLLSGRYLILIDALDEIPDSSGRKRLLQRLKGLRRSLPKVRLVMTTRAAKYTGALGFGPEMEVLELTDLSDDQVNAFCERFRTVKEESPTFLKGLLAALDEVPKRSGPDESHLLANPLLLASACSVFYKLGHLPNDRAALCYQIVEHLCQSKVSQIVKRDWLLPPEQKRDLLQRIALAMQQEKAQVWPTTKVYDVVVEGIPKSQADQRDRIEQYIKWLVEHTGLLYMVAGKGGESIRFHHRLFREYLSACRLTKKNIPIEELLDTMMAEKQLTDPAWLDVVRLMPGAINEPDRAKMMADHLREMAEIQGEKQGSLWAVLAATIVESQNLFRLFDKQSFIFKAVEDYEKHGETWDLPTRHLFLESIGDLGDPRPNPYDKLNWIPFQPTPFSMGGNGIGAEKKHQQKMVTPYWLGRFAVTNGEFEVFVNEGGYKNKKFWSQEGWDWLQLKGKDFDQWFSETKKLYKGSYLFSNPDWYRPDSHPLSWKYQRLKGKNLPVTGISWFEANAYCKWLAGNMIKQPPSWWQEEFGPCVRLPTEAEWEYAARGRFARPYPWANKEKPNTNISNYDETNLGRPAPVGNFPSGATPEGIQDMAGNVWEWCRDVWKDDARETRKRSSQNPENTVGDPAVRVLRGGAWLDDAVSLRASVRGRYRVWDRDAVIGFRCVLSGRSPERG